VIVGRETVVELDDGCDLVPWPPSWVGHSLSLAHDHSTAAAIVGQRSLSRSTNGPAALGHAYLDFFAGG
jgi:hypothetical protein